MIRVELPWPPRELHPNARAHWTKKANAARKARSDAFWATTEVVDYADRCRLHDAFSLLVKVKFCPPDKRRRDVDGMLSNIKAYLDGISDAIEIDDSHWDIAIQRGEVCPNGGVLVELEAA